MTEEWQVQQEIGLAPQWSPQWAETEKGILQKVETCSYYKQDHKRIMWAHWEKIRKTKLRFEMQLENFNAAPTLLLEVEGNLEVPDAPLFFSFTFCSWFAPSLWGVPFPGFCCPSCQPPQTLSPAPILLLAPSLCRYRQTHRQRRLKQDGHWVQGQSQYTALMERCRGWTPSCEERTPKDSWHEGNLRTLAGSKLSTLSLFCFPVTWSTPPKDEVNSMWDMSLSWDWCLSLVFSLSLEDWVVAIGKAEATGRGNWRHPKLEIQLRGQKIKTGVQSELKRGKACPGW